MAQTSPCAWRRRDVHILTGPIGNPQPCAAVGVGWAWSGPPASPQLGIAGGTVKWAAALDSSLQPLKVAQSHHVAQPATFPKTEQGSRKNLHANVHSGSAQPPEATASPGVHRRVSAWTDVLAGGALLVLRPGRQPDATAGECGEHVARGRSGRQLQGPAWGWGRRRASWRAGEHPGVRGRGFWTFGRTECHRVVHAEVVEMANFM